jgi:hypothetical protein
MRHCALTKQDAMKACWGAEVQLHAFLTSALEGGEWSASRPSSLTPRERDRQYPLDRRLGGPQSRSGHGGEEKNPHAVPGLEPPITLLVAQRYTAELPGSCISCLVGSNILLSTFFSNILRGQVSNPPLRNK